MYVLCCSFTVNVNRPKDFNQARRDEMIFDRRVSSCGLSMLLDGMIFDRRVSSCGLSMLLYEMIFDRRVSSCSLKYALRWDDI